MERAPDLVQVCMRTRPLSDAEGPHKKVVFCDRTHCRVEAQGKAARTFAFTQCFDADATQAQVFAQCGVMTQIERSLDGFASLIFAFGQTGAGKTYTMFSALGDEGVQWDTDQSGLIPRSMVYLFEQIAQRESQAPIKFNVRGAFLEIYNEQVSDLLRAGPPLKVHWKEELGFFAENHVVIECSNAEDAIAVVNEGVRNRKVGSHNLNSESSRSHSIFIVDVDCFGTENNGERFLQSGKLLFVDLAGSEKLKQTGSTGEVMHEAKNINKSLLTLGKVISTLSRMHKGKGKKERAEKGGTIRGKFGGGGMDSTSGKQLLQHVPFRDSTLTKLLMHSFMGNAYVLMVCCCAPTMRSADETLATLRYASRAMDIEVNPGTRISLMGDKTPQQQQQQIVLLQEEIKRLRYENRQLQQLASQPSSSLSSPSHSPHSSSFSSPSHTPHTSSSSSSSSPSYSYAKNAKNKAAHRVTPPPFQANNFLPTIHSPSPSHSPLPFSHLSLTRSPSPTRLSPSNLSPIGSPTRSSPLLQMYQQHQLQYQQIQQQFALEEPVSPEDLKRHLGRLEALLSEMSSANSHLKEENSHLTKMYDTTKSEYTRIAHRLDTMEEIFFRQGELSWSPNRALPEMSHADFLKKMQSIPSMPQKHPLKPLTPDKPPTPTDAEKPRTPGSAEKPRTPSDDARMPRTPSDDARMPRTPSDDAKMPRTASGDAKIPRTPSDGAKIPRTPSDGAKKPLTPIEGSKKTSDGERPLSATDEKPPKIPESARTNHTGSQVPTVPPVPLESSRKPLESARKSPHSESAVANETRKPPAVETGPREEDLIQPLDIGKEANERERKEENEREQKQNEREQEKESEREQEENRDEENGEKGYEEAEEDGYGDEDGDEEEIENMNENENGHKNDHENDHENEIEDLDEEVID